MKPENEDKKIDDMISKAIGSKPVFDFEQWKQDHPKQIAAYKEQTTSKPHKLIKYAGIILSAAAMILLAVNCGLGNTDCARLEMGHIQDDILDYAKIEAGSVL